MLLTNGCSFVWGDELEGCYDDPPTHWPHTFTHKLAELLGGMEYINLGTCGGGNDKIFRDTVRYLSNPDNKKPTHMVILWSGWSRAEMAEHWTEDQEIVAKVQRFDGMSQFSPERINNLLEHKWGPTMMFYETSYELRTDIQHGLDKMVAMQLLADSMNIKLIQGCFHHMMKDQMAGTISETASTGMYTKWAKSVRKSMELLRKESKVGLSHWQDMYSMALERFSTKEGNHPDEDTHTEYANLLNHIFTQMETD